MSDPFKEFAALIDKRMQKHAQAATFWAPSVLGTIASGGGLKLDYFNREIKEYLVADWVFDGEIEGDWQVPAHQETGSVILPAIPTQSGGPTTPGEYQATYKFNGWTFAGTGEQKITVSKFKLHIKQQLAPGDRVLVAPVNKGRDFVVIAKVVPK